MMKLKRILSCVCCISILVCGILTYDAAAVQAQGSWPAGPGINGEAAIVMDADTGTVLYEKNIHEKCYPASTTKILTALLALENTRLDEEVTFSYDSVHKTEGSGIWRDVGEIMTMEQCLYALLLNSANECAYAIAEHTGGTYENFVAMMNERAQLLGCEDTHFSNPHGLTEEDHYTSCYDMALIAREAFQNEMFRKITGTKRYDIPPTNKHPDEITYLTNHQKMLWKGETYYYEYCVGGKTGYTEAAGNTLVTYAQKDGMTLICVTMKNKSPYHYEDSIALLDYCFEHFQSYSIPDVLSEIQEEKLPECDFFTASSFAGIDREAKIILPVGADPGEAVLSVKEEAQGTDIIGTLQFTYAGHAAGTTEIRLTREETEPYPFSEKPAEKQENISETTDEDTEKVVYVSAKKIILTVLAVLLGILALAAAGFGIYKLYDNFYLLRYKLHSRKKRNTANEILRRKRRRRRR